MWNLKNAMDDLFAKLKKRQRCREKNVWTPRKGEGWCYVWEDRD